MLNTEEKYLLNVSSNNPRKAAHIQNIQSPNNTSLNLQTSLADRAEILFILKPEQWI